MVWSHREEGTPQGGPLLKEHDTPGRSCDLALRACHAAADILFATDAPERIILPLVSIFAEPTLVTTVRILYSDNSNLFAFLFQMNSEFRFIYCTSPVTPNRAYGQQPQRTVRAQAVSKKVRFRGSEIGVPPA